MEEVLAIVFIFGGATIAIFSYSPIGRAIAARIRGESSTTTAATDPAVLDELDRLREELGQLQERLDFTERLLADRRQPAALEGPED